MSIFRDTFQSNIKAQLEKRQESMLGSNRTPKVIQYLNSRNSWIRMTSSVNVGGDKGDLAKNNVLMGGTLSLQGGSYALKQGVGTSGNEAYTNKVPFGKDPDHRLGIRPMPGIVNMDIKSKSAYGSLREAVVNFQCWDIRQLEDLELLYMRPGYTVLIEWGWLPYLDNKGDLVTTLPNFYDILSKGTTDRSKIFKELYDKCTNSGGNYDAMFGYVKNYQWSARPDGGYDCQTTIISTGEIVESLKVNYVLPDLTKLNDANQDSSAFLDAEFANQSGYPRNFFKEHYEKNILAGLWAETMFKYKLPNITIPAGSVFDNGKIKQYTLPSLKTINTSDVTSVAGGSNYQVYITLEAMFDVLNKYVIPEDEAGNKLITLSLNTEGYTGTSDPLLCLAHPLQISVDPSVCVIKSPLWYETGGILYAVSSSGGGAALTPAQTIANKIKAAATLFATDRGQALTDFTTAIKEIDTPTLYSAVDLALSPNSIQSYLTKGGTFGNLVISTYDDIFSHLKQASVLGPNGVSFTTSIVIDPATSTSSDFLNTVTITIPPLPPATAAAITAIANLPQAIANLKLLGDLKQNYFEDNDKGYNELGIIKNIYVNVDFLYKKSLDANIESTDGKEKNEISLYKYLKSIMSAIQTSIGNVSNFEIHVDPVDSKVRVIDVNYTAKTIPSLFELQVHNTKSVVRNYSLQSQIFPEQSSIIAIGSQAKGGQLGIQNNTMIDFNKGLIDRIIPKKLFSGGKEIPEPDSNNNTAIASNLGSIVALFGNLMADPPPAGIDLNNLFVRAKNNLRDLIVYFQSITASPSATKNIIPFKFSFEMDGIGGLVIGHLFKINEDIIPKGYKGIGAGSKLAQTVTGISHTVKDGDWITKIDALNIILDNKSGKPFKSLDLKTLVEQSFKNTLFPTTTAATATGNAPVGTPCVDPYDPKNLISGGWLGKKQPFTRTIVDPAVEGPILTKSYGKTLAQAILAVMKKEQSFSGFNWNLGGYDITSGGWKYNVFLHNGYVVAREGGTNLCKAYISFNNFQSYIAQTVTSFKNKGFDKATTASQFAKIWYEKWNAFGARAKKPAEVSDADWDAQVLKKAEDAWNEVAKYL